MTGKGKRMPQDAPAPASGAALRERAEAAFLEKAARAPQSTAARSPQATRQLLHELQVHQIELEMQNEELRRAQAELDEARSRYFDLYDLAPVGYCSVSEAGLILEANLTAAALLGVARGALVKQPISRYILREDQDSYGRLRKRLVDTGEPQSCDLRLVAGEGTTIWAHLTAALVENDNGRRNMRLALADITQGKQAEEEIRRREMRYRALIGSSTDAVVTADGTGRITNWNPAAERIFGYLEAEVIGQPLTLLMPLRFQERHSDGIKRVQSGGERRIIGSAVELTGRRKDGSEFPLELSLAQWSVQEGHFFTGFIRDISARKDAEAKIQRLTQIYAALSQCNQAIVHCDREAELLPRVCQVAVQDGGLKMAAILMLEAETRGLRPVASFGEGADYLNQVEITADSERVSGRGPSGTAIREKRPYWCQDFAHDPITAPWRGAGARYGWAATASLPLYRNGAVAGVFNLFSDQANAFDPGVRDLLLEMAADVSFALDSFDRESARAREQMELKAAEEQFRALVEQSITGIYIIQDGRFAYVNSRFAEIRGFAGADDLIGRDPLPLVAEQDRSTIAENNRRLLAGEIPSISYAFTALSKDGSAVEVGVSSTVATYRGRPAIIGMMQDISEKKRAEEKIQQSIEELKSALLSTVEVATTLSEMRDPYTAGHERRVGALASAIGAELGFDAQRIEGLRVAGYLHDIGKITIPAEILSKPGKLSPIEFRLIQSHAQSSYDVLKDVKFPWPVAEIALEHHERMDGSGYPRGLKGEAILFDARILAVADVVEAMSSYRPYRPGLGIDAALAEIERGRGSAYDPAVADACLNLFREKGYAIPA